MFLLFSKSFTWETNLWVALGDFTRIGKGNLYLTENWLSRNKMWCAADNHNYAGEEKSVKIPSDTKRGN